MLKIGKRGDLGGTGFYCCAFVEEGQDLVKEGGISSGKVVADGNGFCNFSCIAAKAKKGLLSAGSLKVKKGK